MTGPVNMPNCFGPSMFLGIPTAPRFLDMTNNAYISKRHMTK